MPIYDAAMLYKHDDRPLVVVAGKEYGTGSSRDWAAKGTVLLGVRAVIAESFERIHRSNLVGMGVLPLQFADGENAESLGIDGSEKFSIAGVAELKPRQDVEVVVRRQDKSEFTITARCRIDTYNELEYFRSAESSITCFEGWRPLTRHRARGRNRRLGRRGADPARIWLVTMGKVTGKSLAYQAINVFGAAGFVNQRVVASAHCHRRH